MTDESGAGVLAHVRTKSDTLQMSRKTANFQIVEDETLLIVSALDDLIDALAAFGPDGEDRESDLCDEPEPDEGYDRQAVAPTS